MCRISFLPGRAAHACLLGLLFLLSVGMKGQNNNNDDGAKPISFEDGIRPIPILTGSTAYFTRVTAGQFQDAPSVSPLLLLPLGDRWLIEGKGSYSDTYTTNAQGNYVGKASYGLSYLQTDFITKYVTVSAGRFAAPFGVYNERLAPHWIRDLPISPMINSPLTGSAAGGVIPGGFPAGTPKNKIELAPFFFSSHTQ